MKKNERSANQTDSAAPVKSWNYIHDYLGGTEMPETIETHPIRSHLCPDKIPRPIAMQAYEVYREVFGPEEAMVTGGCRGGFSAGELIAFLYARSFPKSEWKARINEALGGAEEER